MQALIPALHVAGVVVSVFVFAYSIVFGPVSILTLYAVWFAIAALSWRTLLKAPGRIAPLLLLPAFGILSMFWSETPGQSLRAGIQYASTIVIAIIAARLIDTRRLLLGLSAASFLVMGYSISVGRYRYDPIDGAFAFVGAFGSKNQLGLYASVFALAAISLALMRSAGAPTRVLALAAAGLSLVMLSLSDSATSIITTAPLAALVVLATPILRLSPASRLTTVVAGLVLSAVSLAVAFDMGYFDRLLGVFGKDTTLTGRTYLWAEGIAAGSRNALFGMGYQAFWVHGNADAERLWDVFYIQGRAGFHFHNTFIEAFVGLGLIGVILVATITLTAIAAPAALLLGRRADTGVICMLCLAMLFSIRSFVEIDYFQPYTIGTFLIHVVIVKALDQLFAARRVAAPRPQLSARRAAPPDAPTGPQAAF